MSELVVPLIAVCTFVLGFVLGLRRKVVDILLGAKEKLKTAEQKHADAKRELLEYDALTKEQKRAVELWCLSDMLRGCPLYDEPIIQEAADLADRTAITMGQQHGFDYGDVSKFVL